MAFSPFVMAEHPGGDSRAEAPTFCTASRATGRRRPYSRRFKRSGTTQRGRARPGLARLNRPLKSESANPLACTPQVLTAPAAAGCTERIFRANQNQLPTGTGSHHTRTQCPSSWSSCSGALLRCVSRGSPRDGRGHHVCRGLRRRSAEALDGCALFRRSYRQDPESVARFVHCHDCALAQLR